MIASYSFGRIEIDGVVYSSDVKILPDRTVVADWWRLEGHELRLPDIKDIMKASPDILIVGTGASGMMVVTAEVEAAFIEASIELIVERSGEAWRIFNELCVHKRAAAAIHLTC